ncbi:RNA polymerase sigma factor [Paractinoplanes lichenicola]|uniref:Sigma-70 family RNA polymerase sigma factor n=1 Tax=Paractinoplanes lichenicola TaxID=2802976 RepID=A0ABS1VSW1_9ACTN|nr:sigma-70 family RNA polymerase sigma factor [Actinoplanes lichenicola]MBL7257552.1 sigma-70 family RNA polymerase sigma factor [Actinoplanes lichenicola]
MNPDERRRRFEAVAPAVVDAVRRYLARRTDAATADDVLQETLLVCWRRLDDMPAVELLPWAYGIARLCLANAERSHRRQNRLVARILRLDPPGAVTRMVDDTDGELAEAMARLRPDDVELLRLWAWEDLTPGEIATVLGISANAASIRLHRAKQKLRDELRKHSHPGGHEELTEGRRP